MVKTDPILYLLTKPVLSGQLARWLFQLSKFDITCVVPRTIKSQAIIDMIISFYGENALRLLEELLGEITYMVVFTIPELPES